MNYVLSNLVEAGLIRAKRFKNSKNKIAYMSILTPADVWLVILSTVTGVIFGIFIVFFMEYIKKTKTDIAL